MNTTIEKISFIAIVMIVVLFLLFDGGAVTEATISRGLATDGARIGQSWIWIFPTLLIFGIGFAVAWLVLGKDEAPKAVSNPTLNVPIESSSQKILHPSGYE